MKAIKIGLNCLYIIFIHLFLKCKGENFHLNFLQKYKNLESSGCQSVSSAVQNYRNDSSAVLREIQTYVARFSE